jgi:hypothetical protein
LHGNGLARHQGFGYLGYVFELSWDAGLLLKI